MPSFKEFYKELIINPDLWEYYDGAFSNLNTNNLLADNKNYCFWFISEYLKKGGKATDLINSLLELLNKKRYKHTVSCFFLGIGLYHHCEVIKNNINSLITKIRINQDNESDKERFYYIWFLTCLFHDIGYAIEDKRIYKNQMQKLKINDAFNSFLKYEQWKRTAYSKDTIKKYKSYRENLCDKGEHGIGGGSLLFNELRALRKERCEKPSGNPKLYWGEELIKDFHLASQTIVCHNIYKIDETDKKRKCYECYKLEKLITDIKLIKLKNHPLLFLLCLADSIEPIKTVHDCMYLDKIVIDIKGQDITISICKLPSQIRDSFSKRIYDLNDWLTDVERDENIMIIHIKQ